MPSWHLAGQQCWASPGMGGQSLTFSTSGERHPSPAHPKPPLPLYAHPDTPLCLMLSEGGAGGGEGQVGGPCSPPAGCPQAGAAEPGAFQ